MGLGRALRLRVQTKSPTHRLDGGGGTVPSHVHGGLLLGVFLVGGALSDERYSEALTARRVRVDSGDLETLWLLVPADAFLKSRSRLRICA